MKLRVKRYNTRRSEIAPEPAPPPVTPRPAQRPQPVAMPSGAERRPDPQIIDATPAPRQVPQQTPDEALFAQTEDGFGAAPYPTAAPSGTTQAMTSPAETAAGTDLDAIRREGLTGRQLRLARRMAQKYGLPATSDFDAVRLLRQAGLDPFRPNPVVEIVAEEDGDAEGAPRPGNMMPVPAGARLPQTIKPVKMPAPGEEVNHAAEILKMQQDLARRRRRRSMLMMARLFFFVILPTFLAGF